MSYKTGKSKSLDDITLDDALTYHIWEWTLDEEGNEDQDETWQRPIIDTNDVTEDMVSPIITLQIKGTDYYASGEYDNDEKLVRAVSFWDENRWKLPQEFTKIAFPIILVSLASIDGNDKEEFMLEKPTSDEAFRI